MFIIYEYLFSVYIIVHIYYFMFYVSCIIFIYFLLVLSFGLGGVLN